LSVAYGRSTVLNRLTLSIPAGSLYALAGPSGAGKTTLLRCLLGLVPARAGEARVLGGRPGQRSSAVGYLPQSDPADWRFPLSVAEAVLLGRYRRLGPLGRVGSDDRAAVADALSLVGLSAQATLPVGSLTSVARRRLGLARALAGKPDLVLLDDPLAGLDGEAEAELFDLIGRLPERGLTVLLVTRDLNRLGERYARLALLNGLLIADGEPGQVLTVDNLRATYGARSVLVRVPAAHFAVDG
jgi:ABC-type Mn2+/Zn2+ transport system ATPase subunit